MMVKPGAAGQKISAVFPCYTVTIPKKVPQTQLGCLLSIVTEM